MSDPRYVRAFRAWCVESGVEWETIRYTRPAAGGETKGHRLSPAKPVRGGVLVVHGAGNDALFSLTGIFVALLRAGLEVFTFDLDGHGRDGSTVLAMESAPDAVAAALEAWGGPSGGGPLHALGISLGGALLLNALPRLGSALESASLASTPLRVELSWRSVAHELGTPMWRTMWRERRHFGLTGLIPSFGPFRRDLYPLRLADPPGPGAFGYVPVLNRLLERLELLEAARRTEIPVLVVHGERDALVPAVQARSIAAALPRSQLVILPHHSHLTAPLAPETLELLVSRAVRSADESVR